MKAVRTVGSNGRLLTRACAILAALLLGLSACKKSGADEDGSPSAGTSGGSSGASGKSGEGGSAAGDAAGTSGSAGRAGSDSPRAGDASTEDADAAAGSDAGELPDGDGGPSDDAATDDPDAGTLDEDASIPDDSGVGIGSGSCCATHDTPGCSNADLQVCVCELDPSCCTDAWSAGCVLIVEHKYCQPGVRECVCEEWEQASCCDVDWTDNFCDGVAVDMCDATPGCA